MNDKEGYSRPQVRAGMYLEAGRSQLLCMVIQDIEQSLILNACHLQDLSSAIADVAGIQ